MADTVWKYELAGVENHLSLPKGAQVLWVAEQHNRITMWVRVDPMAGEQLRTFYVVGTGTPVPDGAKKFLGTALVNGNFVFHVFERVGGESGVQ